MKLFLLLLVFIAASIVTTKKASSSSSHIVVSALGVVTSPRRPIVVFGGGDGKTGKIITQILADDKQYVRAVSRRPRPSTRGSSSSSSTTPTTLHDNKGEHQRQYISYTECDVRSYDNVLSVLQQQEQGTTTTTKNNVVGVAGVIWAVTSSGVKKGGGDAYDVDYRGAFHVAKACLVCNVPKLVFISAGCVTRPQSLGSRTVNWLTQFTYGNIPWTDAKMAGEAAVRDLYHNRSTKNNDNVAYAIVRPCAALATDNKPPIDVPDLIVMQGDVYSSAESISRVNVANVVVQTLLKGKATDFVTLEVCPCTKMYKNDEGNFIDLLGLKTRKQTSFPDLPKSLIHRDASSYEDLLDGLLTDEELHKQYRSIVSDYRGEEGLPSLIIDD